MDRIQQAALDTIAFGESGSGKNYNVLFGGGHFTDFSRFPLWHGVRIRGVWTHAAGRYQFEPHTWVGVAAALGLKDFSPESQDLGAWWLAQQVYHHFTGRGFEADLTAKVLNHAGAALHSTWTSVSSGTFPIRFERALAALPESPSAPPTSGA